MNNPKGSLTSAGAGLDTFAWRRPSEMADLRVFETDHPATLAQKEQRLQRAGIGIPTNYERVPVDFEAEDLQPALRKFGFDQTIPSLFCCRLAGRH